MSNHRILPLRIEQKRPRQPLAADLGERLAVGIEQIRELRAGLRRAPPGALAADSFTAMPTTATPACRTARPHPAQGRRAARAPSADRPSKTRRPSPSCRQTRRASSVPLSPTCGSSIAGIVSPTFTLHSASWLFDSTHRRHLRPAVRIRPIERGPQLSALVSFAGSVGCRLVSAESRFAVAAGIVGRSPAACRLRRSVVAVGDCSATPVATSIVADACCICIPQLNRNHQPVTTQNRFATSCPYHNPSIRVAPTRRT